MFENDVKTYGTQALSKPYLDNLWFENDVKTYGTQAKEYDPRIDERLRMM